MCAETKSAGCERTDSATQTFTAAHSCLRVTRVSICEGQLTARDTELMKTYMGLAAAALTRTLMHFVSFNLDLHQHYQRQKQAVR